MQDLAYTRRDLLRLGSGLAAMAALGGLPACEQGQPLRVAIQPWAGYQFIALAREEGWLASAGLQLVDTSDNAMSLAALIQGQVDAAALTLDGALNLLEQGIKVIVVMVFDVSAGADAVLAKPEIKTLAELKGKRVGVENSSLGAIMLAKVLEFSGLSKADLTVIQMGSDHAKSWDNDKLDAIITYEPTLTQLLARGAMRLFDSRSLPQAIFDVLVVRTEAAERHSHALRKLIAGHFRGLKLWHNNPIDTTYRLSKLLGVKPDEVRGVLKGLDIPDAIYNQRYLVAPADELVHATQFMMQIMVHEQMLKHPLNFEGLFVPDYLMETAE